MARGSQRNRARRRGLRAALSTIACCAPAASLVAPVARTARASVQRSAYDMGGPPGFGGGPFGPGDDDEDGGGGGGNDRVGAGSGA